MMPKEKEGLTNKIKLIRELMVSINEIPKKAPVKKDGSHLVVWEHEIDYCRKNMLMIITKFFGSSSTYIQELNNIPIPSAEIVHQDYLRILDPSSAHFITGPPPGNFYYQFAGPAINLLRILIDDLEMAPIKTLDSDAVALVRNLCDKFHNVVNQLEKRHDNRESLRIKDEYDVQDLFHALLHLHFDDIRDEESMPSLAGISSRVDFLLMNEKIGIEIKMTKQTLRNKELRSQLSVDIKSYERHPDFNVLIFFVYDPDRLIENPRGFESDFNKERDGLLVHVFIRS